MMPNYGAMYHILFQSPYGIWTINPLKVHLVLKVSDMLAPSWALLLAVARS